MEFTVRQIHRYAALGAGGIHIFTLNRWEAAGSIVEMSGLLRRA
jgi:5,10-methylenetetrahydrofolate reductase